MRNIQKKDFKRSLSVIENRLYIPFGSIVGKHKSKAQKLSILKKDRSQSHQTKLHSHVPKTFLKEPVNKQITKQAKKKVLNEKANLIISKSFCKFETKYNKELKLTKKCKKIVENIKHEKFSMNPIYANQKLYDFSQKQNTNFNQYKENIQESLIYSKNQLQFIQDHEQSSSQYIQKSSVNTLNSIKMFPYGQKAFEVFSRNQLQNPNKLVVPTGKLQMCSLIKIKAQAMDKIQSHNIAESDYPPDLQKKHLINTSICNFKSSKTNVHIKLSSIKISAMIRKINNFGIDLELIVFDSLKFNHSNNHYSHSKISMFGNIILKGNKTLKIYHQIFHKKSPRKHRGDQAQNKPIQLSKQKLFNAFKMNSIEQFKKYFKKYCYEFLSLKKVKNTYRIKQISQVNAYNSDKALYLLSCLQIQNKKYFIQGTCKRCEDVLCKLREWNSSTQILINKQTPKLTLITKVRQMEILSALQNFSQTLKKQFFISRKSKQLQDIELPIQFTNKVYDTKIIEYGQNTEFFKKPKLVYHKNLPPILNKIWSSQNCQNDHCDQIQLEQILEQQIYYKKQDCIYQSAENLKNNSQQELLDYDTKEKKLNKQMIKQNKDSIKSLPKSSQFYHKKKNDLKKSISCQKLSFTQGQNLVVKTRNQQFFRDLGSLDFGQILHKNRFFQISANTIYIISFHLNKQSNKVQVYISGQIITSPQVILVKQTSRFQQQRIANTQIAQTPKVIYNSSVHTLKGLKKIEKSFQNGSSQKKIFHCVKNKTQFEIMFQSVGKNMMSRYFIKITNLKNFRTDMLEIEGLYSWQCFNKLLQVNRRKGQIQTILNNFCDSMKKYSIFTYSKYFSDHSILTQQTDRFLVKRKIVLYDVVLKKLITLGQSIFLLLSIIKYRKMNLTILKIYANWVSKTYFINITQITKQNQLNIFRNLSRQKDELKNRRGKAYTKVKFSYTLESQISNFQKQILSFFTQLLKSTFFSQIVCEKKLKVKNKKFNRYKFLLPTNLLFNDSSHYIKNNRQVFEPQIPKSIFAQTKQQKQNLIGYHKNMISIRHSKNGVRGSQIDLHSSSKKAKYSFEQKLGSLLEMHQLCYENCFTISYVDTIQKRQKTFYIQAYEVIDKKVIRKRQNSNQNIKNQSKKISQYQVNGNFVIEIYQNSKSLIYKKYIDWNQISYKKLYDNIISENKSVLSNPFSVTKILCQNIFDMMIQQAQKIFSQVRTILSRSLITCIQSFFDKFENQKQQARQQKLILYRKMINTTLQFRAQFQRKSEQQIRLYKFNHIHPQKREISLSSQLMNFYPKISAQNINKRLMKRIFYLIKAKQVL